MDRSLFRRRALAGAIALLAFAGAACDGPIFKPSSTPSVSLTSEAGNPERVGALITFHVSTSIPGNLANVFIQATHIDFGDGQSAELGTALPAVSHAYAWPGTFTATATATDSLGHSAKAALQVVVGANAPTPPSVGLTSDATNPSPVGAVVTFTVSASIPGAGAGVAVSTVHLDFGDGQSAELGAVPPAGGVPHTYITAGTYVATATATGTNGLQAHASLTIVVNGAGKTYSPSIGLTPGTSSVTLGTAISFTVAASIPGAPAGIVIQNIHLDFGDGQGVDLGASPPLGGVSHTYGALGTYTATATVTDTSGKSASASATVVVK